MKNRKRLLSLLISIVMACSLSSFTSLAYAADCNPVNEVHTGIVLRMVFSYAVNVTSSNSVVFTVHYRAADNLDNASGKYITSVDSITVADSGDYSYAGNASVISTTYGNNHQSAQVNISYWARSSFESSPSQHTTTLYFSLV